MLPLFGFFIGKCRRGRLVIWVEMVRLDDIKQLLEITKRECNHELLFSVKNLQELGANPFPYIVPVLPHPFPEELVKGEHFVLADLLKLITGSSS